MLLFSLSLFASSFLLFQVQPMIGKYILPWFGSSPAMWSTSLLFFQSILTAGYAYAYALVNRLSLSKQGIVHLLLSTITLIVLILGFIFWHSPVLPDARWQPQATHAPVLDVLKVLAVAVGLPYFLLATNSTLLQAWFHRLFPNRSPYRLYALSNAASLLGLLSYPFLIEPFFPISVQARLWALGYLVFLFTIMAISQRVVKEASEKLLRLGESEESVSLRYPSKYEKMQWVVLPSIASVLLLATTNQITQEVAVIPFLWVLPLSLYLFSFILCFANDRWYGRKRFIFLLVISAAVYGLMLQQGPLVDLRIQVATYCLLLFVCAMVCHGELARLRPHPVHLSSYYLSISIGGALGGFLVSIVAPAVFKDYWELPLGLVLCFGVYLINILIMNSGQSRWFTIGASLVLIASLIGIAVFSIQDMRSLLRGSSWIERNFFGVVRVRKIMVEENNETAYRLIHGITVHGLQFTKPALRRMPTTYYTEISGVGLAFRYHPNREQGLKVGVLGLGTGTLAVYGSEKDSIRFYEINPAVVKIAEGEGGYFSFLGDSRAHIEIVLGDARLSLERELDEEGPQFFDLLVVDTFSSDAIPVHLITLEALELYLKHLKPNGILALHISNIHLDLEPVIKKLAKHLHQKVAFVASGKFKPGSSPAVWMLLTNNEEFLSQPVVQQFVVDLSNFDSPIPLWTDDYSNLFLILR